MSTRRRITYKMYPNKGQLQALEQMHFLHRQLYNACLEERIDAYRKHKKSIGFHDQCKSLTEIRGFDAAYAQINAQSLQVTLKRVDLAYKAFFRRVTAGKTPGFPRFKSKNRFSGFGYKTHGDGFRFTPGADWVNGTLRLSGIGDITVRGQARTQGRVVACDVMRRVDGWFVSIVIECEPTRKGGERVCGMDWGVETFLTLAYGEDDFDSVENDRLYQQHKDKISQKQRELARGKRGSKTSQKRRKALAKLHRKLANKRKDRAHKVSHRLVREHGVIFTEELSIANMVRSAKGDEANPGKNVAQKAGLNREILDTAPAMFLSMLEYKAEEAGIWVVYLNTRKHKFSQSCPSCGVVRKKRLSERRHKCDDCGADMSRDQASALQMLMVGRNEHGDGNAPGLCPETPSLAA